MVEHDLDRHLREQGDTTVRPATCHNCENYKMVQNNGIKYMVCTLHLHAISAHDCEGYEEAIPF